MSITMIVIGVGILIVIFVVISVFNSLVKLKNRCDNAFAQIEVQLKRRYDLIPNLVETAKGYMSHEKETLEAVVSARNTAKSALDKLASNPNAMGELAGAESSLQSAMGNFNLVMEAYPDLKASQNMMSLQEELSSTENKVAFARQAFNDAVMAYNTYKQSFPAVIMAAGMGHAADKSQLVFEDSAQIQAAPKVSF